MSEIKCLKCGEVFTVDGSGYAAIVEQVKNEEFQKELREREELLKIAASAETEKLKAVIENAKKDTEKELELAEANAKANLEKSLADSNQEIDRLKALVSSATKGKENSLEIEKAKAQVSLEKVLLNFNLKSIN